MILAAALQDMWCGAPIECCQCDNVANTNVVSFQFVTQLSQLKIGIENWQHLHIGNNLPQNQAISKIPQ